MSWRGYGNLWPRPYIEPPEPGSPSPWQRVRAWLRRRFKK